MPEAASEKFVSVSCSEGLSRSREVLLVDFRLAFFTCFQSLIRLKDFSPSGLARHDESVTFSPPCLRFPPL